MKQRGFDFYERARENDLMTMSGEKLERIFAEYDERHRREVDSWKPRRVALVACSKKKWPTAAPARELYRGTLFRYAAEYAEVVADEWYILSAKYGLVEPDRVIEPYDMTMRQRRGAQAKYQWALVCANDLGRKKLGRGSKILMLAGTDYAQFLGPILEERGFKIERSLAGMGYGCQVSWLSQRVDELLGAPVVE